MVLLWLEGTKKPPLPFPTDNLENPFRLFSGAWELLIDALLFLPELRAALVGREGRPFSFSSPISMSSSHVCLSRLCSLIALESSATGRKCSFISPKIPFV